MLPAEHIVVGIVGGGDLQAACAEIHLNVFVFDDGNLAADQRNDDALPLEVGVLRVVGVDVDVAVLVEPQVSVGVQVAHGAAFGHDEVGAAHAGDLILLERIVFVRLRVVVVVHQLDDLVLVVAEREAGAPREVPPCLVVSDRKLETLVFDVARLRVHVFVAGRTRQGHEEGLVFGVGLVVGEVQRERIGEQSGVQTHLPRGRVLRAEILDRSGGARGPRTLLPFVGQVGDAPKNRAAHFGPRSPHLEIVDERGELHHFVNQSRKADRGEAVRQVVRVGIRCGPWP